MKLISILTLAAMAGPTFAGAQDSSMTADQILAKMQEKRGTADKVAAAKTRKISGTWSFDQMEGGGSFTEFHGNLSQTYYTSVYTGVGDFVMGNAGPVVWEENPMAGVTIKQGFDAANLLRTFALKKHADWRVLFKSAELLGREEHDGRPHFKLKMNPKAITVDETCKDTVGSEEDPPSFWFIDAETYLLSRIDMRIMSPMGQPSDVTQTFTDWKRVDGLLYAHNFNSAMGPFSWTIKTTKVEHNVKFGKDRFLLSEKVKEAVARTKEGASQDMNEIIIEELEARHVATIRSKCKPQDIAKEMSICLPEVMVYINKIGAQTVGAPFSRYHSFGPETIDLESGMFVAEPIEPNDRVKASKLPAGKAAVAWHVGPYEDLGKSYERLAKWVKDNGYEAASPPWEIYWTDPGMEPDPTKWRTQLFQPVKKVEKVEKE